MKPSIFSSSGRSFAAMSRYSFRRSGSGSTSKITAYIALPRWLRLLRLDDRAADRAGAGEQLLERVAFAPADRPLQRGQVLGEALDDVQHRLAIAQKDVAPHDRVG